jgi:hypothetical protein
MPIVNTDDIGIKFYLNGFPKSGLHLLDLMVRPLALPMKADKFTAPWVGMFYEQSFSLDQVPGKQITWGIGRTEAGHFTKGHIGHNELLENFLYYLGIVHIFIYRDFRDVAVSLVYHIMNDVQVEGVDLLAHPGKEEIRALGGFDEMLTAVISGTGRFPGLMERWERYCGWLNAPWVLRVRFEEARKDPHQAARDITLFALKRHAHIADSKIELDEKKLDALVEEMVYSSRQTHLSATFRKGKAGKWRDYFTLGHIEQMKQADKNNWLARLGYVDRPDWMYE